MRIQAKILASTLCALLLSTCEKPSYQGSQVKTGPEAKENTQSFPPLPELWQEKGGMAEATEDLKALHVAMQRYLEANGDIWPQAPRVMMDDVVPSEQTLQEHVEHQDNLVEPNAASLAAYRKFWEDTLKPFGATARHWQHSGKPTGLLNAAFYNANRFTQEKRAAYRENNGDEGLRWRTSEAVWFSIEAYGGGDKIFITASGRLEDPGVDVTVKLPVESRTQSLTRSTGTLVKINIRKSGAYVIQEKPVTEEELTKLMSEEFGKKPDLKVLIRCDKEAKHLYLASVMSICRQVGVPHANIAIKTEQ
ncbi:MAG: biopolymer transporter ExbD [Verrucomicrobiaceae bacterium]|nr:biopolymer transporter ExbD [Verrucomicrobiaceae bacterium]